MFSMLIAPPVMELAGSGSRIPGIFDEKYNPSFNGQQSRRSTALRKTAGTFSPRLWKFDSILISNGLVFLSRARNLFDRLMGQFHRSSACAVRHNADLCETSSGRHSDVREIRILSEGTCNSAGRTG